MGDDYKKKRQESMVRAFRETYGPSMGCQTDKVVCAICGHLEGGPACEHVSSVLAGDHKIGVLSNFKLSDTRRDIERIRELDVPEEGLTFGGRHEGVAGHIELLYFTTVPAPRCEGCGQPMKGVQGTAWACTNMLCERQGQSVETGIGMVLGEVADG